MAIIANPIYDSVFKYLMEDQRVAKVVLSNLLQRNVVEVTMRSNEYTQKLKDDISVLRIDFGAKIRDDDGEIENVNIELQKAWLTSEIIRFRNYLAQQYQSQDNKFIISDKPLYEKPLHIVNIYLLGHEVANLENPVTYEYPRMFDQFGNLVDDTIKNVDFANELIHDMIIVQIPRLKKSSVVTKLDKLLMLFDQTQKMQNEHQLRVEEESVSMEHKCVFNRLIQANSDEDICRQMQVEDEFQSVLDSYELEKSEAKETIKKQKATIAEQKTMIAEQKEALANKDAQLEKYKEKLRSLGLLD